MSWLSPFDDCANDEHEYADSPDEPGIGHSHHKIRWHDIEQPDDNFPYSIFIDLGSCPYCPGEDEGHIVETLARFDSEENAVAAALLLTEVAPPSFDYGGDRYIENIVSVSNITPTRNYGHIINYTVLPINPRHLIESLVLSVFDDFVDYEEGYLNQRNYELIKEPIDKTKSRYKRVSFFGSYRDAWVAQQALNVLLPKEHHVGAGVWRRSQLAIRPVSGAPMPDVDVPHNYEFAEALITPLLVAIRQSKRVKPSRYTNSFEREPIEAKIGPEPNRYRAIREGESVKKPNPNFHSSLATTFSTAASAIVRNGSTESIS